MKRILAWNVNHRAARRRLPPWLAPSILAVSPDVVVLSEYVEGEDHCTFLQALEAGGLAHVRRTARTKAENQLLIAARDELEAGDLQPPPIYSSVPLNALHVVTSSGLNVLGFRMPSGEPFDSQFKRPTWDWLVEAATRLRDKPSVVIGDFNTAPGDDPVSRCGDCFARMSQIGWFHALPDSGCTFTFRHSSGIERQIDHCFTSPKISARRVEYRWDFQTAGPTHRSGKPGVPDHAMLIADVEYRVGAERAREPGGEMSIIGKDGKLSNGEIMLEMLGDEPDVSHTSRALAKRLGLPGDVIRRLGENDSVDPAAKDVSDIDER